MEPNAKPSCSKPSCSKLERKDQEAAALRANLHRRKEQQRAWANLAQGNNLTQGKEAENGLVKDDQTATPDET